MQCLKCKYEWEPKVEKPKSCPECKTRLGSQIPSAGSTIALIETAIRDYHYALDRRLHGGVAQDDAIHAIETALGLPWRQGEEKARREKA